MHLPTRLYRRLPEFTADKGKEQQSQGGQHSILAAVWQSDIIRSISIQSSTTEQGVLPDVTVGAALLRVVLVTVAGALQRPPGTKKCGLIALGG